MVFRADEAAQNGYERVERYLVPRTQYADESQRARSREALQDIADKIGPVVETYPSWHPLVCHHNSHNPITTPQENCGYNGLDHTRFFAKGFITCPYGDGQKVIDSVAALPYHPAARHYRHVAAITAERLDVSLYSPDATPILVKCIWEKFINVDGTIPLSIAMPLLLEMELPCWRRSEVAETWETMRPYFLGSPHGSRSSLFVSQETGQAIKKIWNALIHTGMYGPIKV